MDKESPLYSMMMRERVMDKAQATIADGVARAQLEDCAAYLKEDESVAECIARNRKDVISSLDQWAKSLKRAEKAESIIASLKVTVEMLEAGIAADAEVIAEKDAEIARLKGQLSDALYDPRTDPKIQG